MGTFIGCVVLLSEALIGFCLMDEQFWQSFKEIWTKERDFPIWERVEGTFQTVEILSFGATFGFGVAALEVHHFTAARVCFAVGIALLSVRLIAIAYKRLRRLLKWIVVSLVYGAAIFGSYTLLGWADDAQTEYLTKISQDENTTLKEFMNEHKPAPRQRDVEKQLKPEQFTTGDKVTVKSKRALPPKRKTSGPNIDMSYDWTKPVKKIAPPREDEAEAGIARLEEEDRIREMEPKERVSYYHQQARALYLFNIAWQSKEGIYDSQGCNVPENNTPQAARRCERLNKLESVRVQNYNQYRFKDLPKARAEDFQDSFPKIYAAVNVMCELCQKKGITVEYPTVTAENAFDLSDFLRTYADKCLSGN
jgi:hypothetical protein